MASTRSHQLDTHRVLQNLPSARYSTAQPSSTFFFTLNILYMQQVQAKSLPFFLPFPIKLPVKLNVNLTEKLTVLTLNRLVIFHGWHFRIPLISDKHWINFWKNFYKCQIRKQIKIVNLDAQRSSTTTKQRGAQRSDTGISLSEWNKRRGVPLY